MDATIARAGRVGFHRVTVAELSVLAGLGPRTFYNHFADLSDVFFEACWQIHEELRRAVKVAHDGPAPRHGRAVVDDGGAPGRDGAGACDDPASGRDRAWGCVEAVVAFVQADPLRARVLFVEGYAGGPAVAELRAETIGWLIGLVVGDDGPGGGGLRSDARSLGAGRRSGAESSGTGLAKGRDRPAGSNAGRLSAEFAVGGINGVLYSRIKAGDLAGLTDLIPSFVDTLAQARSGTGDLRGR